MPEPRITVCGDAGDLNVVPLPLTWALGVGGGTLSEGIVSILRGPQRGERIAESAKPQDRQ